MASEYKDDLDSERGNPLPSLHGRFFPINSKDHLYTPSHRRHHTERELTQWVHHEGSIRRPVAVWADVLPRSYISLLMQRRTQHICIDGYTDIGRMDHNKNSSCWPGSILNRLRVRIHCASGSCFALFKLNSWCIWAAQFPLFYCNQVRQLSEYKRRNPLLPVNRSDSVIDDLQPNYLCCFCFNKKRLICTTCHLVYYRSCEPGRFSNRNVKKKK